MLRRFLAVSLIVLTAVVVFADGRPRAADKSPARLPARPAGLTGIYLTTQYPALTVRAGETTTIDMSLRNYHLPPQQLVLSVPVAASGWKATILGGGQPVERRSLRPTARTSCSCASNRRLAPVPATIIFSSRRAATAASCGCRSP